MPKSTNNYNHGHRERLRQRFKQAGLKALEDYEVLELLLFFAIPRGDVKPIAKELLKRFGSLDAMVEADEKILQEVKGVGPAVSHLLKVQQAMVQRQLRNNIIKKPIFDNMEKIQAYCKMHMAYNMREQLRLLFVDTKRRLIAEEVQQVGTIDQTPVYPREIIKRALDLGAKGLIVVHNHPSGDTTPSNTDITLTLKILTAANSMGIILHDHLIVGRNSCTSLKEKGVF